jgi:hypothetical protein
MICELMQELPPSGGQSMRPSFRSRAPGLAAAIALAAGSVVGTIEAAYGAQRAGIEAKLARVARKAEPPGGAVRRQKGRTSTVRSIPCQFGNPFECRA